MGGGGGGGEHGTHFPLLTIKQISKSQIFFLVSRATGFERKRERVPLGKVSGQ